MLTCLPEARREIDFLIELQADVILAFFCRNESFSWLKFHDKPADKLALTRSLVYTSRLIEPDHVAKMSRVVAVSARFGQRESD